MTRRREPRRRRRGAPPPRATAGTFAIFLGRAPYLDVGHASPEAAEEALADLLSPYPPSSPWRADLYVARVGPPPELGAHVGTARPLEEHVPSEPPP